MKLKNNHYYSAILVENNKREFVVFEYRCNTFYVTGRNPFSLDQCQVEFENIRPLASKELLARDN